MANITRDLYAIFLLIAVLYTGAYAEEEAEDETLSTDRNSLTSIRLPSKYLTGKKGLEILVLLKAWGHSIRGPPKRLFVFQMMYQLHFVCKFVHCSKCIISLALRVSRASKFNISLDSKFLSPQWGRRNLLQITHIFLLNYLHLCTSYWWKWVPGKFPGGKGGRCVSLTTSPPSCAECHGNLGA
jgi:hypothetical protein